MKSRFAQNKAKPGSNLYRLCLGSFDWKESFLISLMFKNMPEDNPGEVQIFLDKNNFSRQKDEV